MVDLEYVLIRLVYFVGFFLLTLMFRKLIEKRAKAPNSSTLCQTFFASRNIYATVMALVVMGIILLLQILIRTLFFST